MPKRVRRWRVRIGTIVAGVLVLIVWLHLGLLYMGHGILLSIGGFQIIRLGTSTESVFSPQIESAIEKCTDKIGSTLRIAKYIDDVLVNSESNGAINATSLSTNSTRLYRFQSYTSYIGHFLSCVIAKTRTLATKEMQAAQGEIPAALESDRPAAVPRLCARPLIQVMQAAPQAKERDMPVH